MKYKLYLLLIRIYDKLVSYFTKKAQYYGQRSWELEQQLLIREYIENDTRVTKELFENDTRVTKELFEIYADTDSVKISE